MVKKELAKWLVNVVVLPAVVVVVRKRLFALIDKYM
jgi:hypothetical protein